MPRPKSRNPEQDPAAKLGELLAELRAEAGYATQDALAVAIHVSRDVIAKAESGYQPPTQDVFDAIMAKCNATERERKVYLGMLVLARAVRGPVPQFFQKYLEREREAEYLLVWCPVIVSGLFQVSEYARELFYAVGEAEDEATASVGARLDRQAVIDGPDAPHVTLLLHESVLYRLVGTPEIMIKQLRNLLEMSRRPNVSIQVVRDKRYFWGLEGPFEIASGEEITDTVVMVAVEDQTVDDKKVVRKATRLFRKVQGRAVSSDETEALITEAIQQWSHQQ
jgi:transcriptional regulator with XRE-family HTH domain